jgi:hypothetical protein
MGEWSAMLKGESFDLQGLTQQFRSPELRVTCESDGWFLHAAEFTDAKDANEVRDLSLELIKRLNGVAKLFHPNFRAVAFGGSIDFHDGEQRHVYLFPTLDEGRSRDSASLATDGKTVALTISETRMAMCAMNDRVARALRLFGYEHTWDNLYKVYEVIEEEIGGEAIRNNWPNGHRLRSFTSTANNWQAVGDAARHGHKKLDPPKNPMPLTEAANLIREWLGFWLKLK